MAQGLFCTLLVGTILNTLGQQFGIGFLTRIIVTVGKGEGAVGYTIGGLASAMVGPGIAVAIGFALHCPTLVLFSLIPVGFAANAMGRRGRAAGGIRRRHRRGGMRQAGGKGDQNRHSGDARRDGSGRHRHCASGSSAHRYGGQRRRQLHQVGNGASALFHGHCGIRRRGRGADAAHFLRRHLRGAGTDGSCRAAPPWQGAAPRWWASR